MKIFRFFFIIVCFVIVWHGIVIFFELPSFILPTPETVFHTFFNNINLLSYHAAITLLEALSGFLIASLLGISAALLMAYFLPLRFLLQPLIIISQALPVFALAPLLILWFGYGLTSKIMITTLMLFFPVCSAFFDGLLHTPKHWLQLANSITNSRKQLFLQIKIPAALPSLCSGLRIAAVFAPMGAIIGEWVGSNSGLGYLLLTANARLEIDLVFSGLIVIIIMALCLFFILDYCLKKWVTW